MSKVPDKIDWANLRQATGSCEHIPDALSELCSVDKLRRTAAYWLIDNHVVLQGDLYEAAPFVAGELVARLGHNRHGVDEIYDLLIELAGGYADDSDTVVVNGARMPLKLATQLAVEQGIPKYVADLQSEFATVRQSAVELLMRVDPSKIQSKDAIRTALRKEQDEQVRALLSDLVSTLSDEPSDGPTRSKTPQ